MVSSLQPAAPEVAAATYLDCSRNQAQLAAMRFAIVG
jgi:hypothetical protein